MPPVSELGSAGGTFDKKKPESAQGKDDLRLGEDNEEADDQVNCL
jgi:hypothetical protein